MASVSSQAYCKILLHAHKYPSQPIFGLLLGKESNSSVQIEDAVPLFHDKVVGPMLEVGLMQVDLMAERMNLKIVGLYTANEHLFNNLLSPLMLEIGDKIKTYFPSTCILLVDNLKISKEPKESELHLYTPEPKKQKEWTKNEKLTIDSTTFTTLEKMLNEEKQYSLFDFDDHLEDPIRDWFNMVLFN
eukprot:TRINITY_DN1245_c0_g1_i1.p1 TRINITY_DN1245_c0_g1~~TRINITY_DN1245_c0_g1_i1.p1  ORF type:complete len:188 (-),score=43.48 TRINITY_DN1245_c0_g1_i1:73-636(-)